MNDTLSSKAKLGIIRKAGATLLQLVSYALGALTFVAVFFASAFILNSPTGLMVLAFAAAATVTALGSHFAGKLFKANKRKLYIAIHAAIFFTLLIITTVHFVLRPLVPEGDQFLPTKIDGVDLWDLPTGSKIAVRQIRTPETNSQDPIIVLHGGPGAYSVSFKPIVDVHSELTNDGHDVYFYDQVGGGLSARLEDITEYSLDRHIADLKAIHDRIGSEQVILIGSSWGATLAANYIAKYPNDVAQAIFSGPGPIYRPDWTETSEGNLDEKMSPEQKRQFDSAIEKPRLFATLILQDINPIAAVNFAPEREMGSFFDKIANDHYLPLAMCDPAKAVARSGGFGFWSIRMTGATLINRTDDPKPALERNNLPVFILRGVCDYKSEDVARQYASVFPNSTYVAINDAGHMIYGESPGEYLRLIREFLN
ncbi:MAG: alpha/beta hydrolase [Pseudomonadota bacterium]